LTRINQVTADNFCRIATGGGITKRKHYSDGEAFSVSVKRFIILNGLDLSIGQMDLLNRALVVSLSPISQEKRRTEEAILEEFETARPRILGALCSAVSAALRAKKYTPERIPRMADAVTFILRAKKGGGFLWPEGTFQRILDKEEATKNEAALEEDPAAPLIIKLAGSVGWND
jgi:hypothetical protein